MLDQSALDQLVTWGPAGVVLTLVLTGWLVPKYAYQREREISDQVHAANELLVSAIDRLTQRLTDALALLKKE